ncbi:hypothetical protein BDZ97DRAFT_1758261 [Flammula alnicola]|nr:hypothetical protein BDZ97DRAFT_1758261 [Flammula alnicola]
MSFFGNYATSPAHRDKQAKIKHKRRAHASWRGHVTRYLPPVFDGVDHRRCFQYTDALDIGGHLFFGSPRQHFFDSFMSPKCKNIHAIFMIEFRVSGNSGNFYSGRLRDSMSTAGQAADKRCQIYHLPKLGRSSQERLGHVRWLPSHTPPVMCGGVSKIQIYCDIVIENDNKKLDPEGDSTRKCSHAPDTRENLNWDSSDRLSRKILLFSFIFLFSSRNYKDERDD